MQWFAVWGWTSVHRVWRLRQPTLLLAGRDDPIVPPVNGCIMARWFPHARLQLLDCGHLFVVARPLETAAAVRDFLDEKRGGQPRCKPVAAARDRAAVTTR